MPRKLSPRMAILVLVLASKSAYAGEVFKVAEGVFFECDIDASMVSMYSEILPSMYESYKYMVQNTPTTWSDLPLFQPCKFVNDDSSSLASSTKEPQNDPTQQSQSAISALTGLGARKAEEPQTESLDNWVCPEDALILSTERYVLEAAGCVRRDDIDLSSLPLDDPYALWACDLEGTGKVERYELGDRNEEFYVSGCSLVSGREAQVTRVLLSLNKDFRDEDGEFFNFSDEDLTYLSQDVRKRYLATRDVLNRRAKEEAERRALIEKLEKEHRDSIASECVYAIHAETMMDSEYKEPSREVHIREILIDEERQVFWGAIFFCMRVEPNHLAYDNRGIPREVPFKIDAVRWLDLASHAEEGKGLSEERIKELRNKFWQELGLSKPYTTLFNDYVEQYEQTTFSRLVFIDGESPIFDVE